MLSHFNLKGIDFRGGLQFRVSVLVFESACTLVVLAWRLCDGCFMFPRCHRHTVWRFFLIRQMRWLHWTASTRPQHDTRQHSVLPLFIHDFTNLGHLSYALSSSPSDNCTAFTLYIYDSIRSTSAALRCRQLSNWFYGPPTVKSALTLLYTGAQSHCQLKAYHSLSASSIVRSVASQSNSHRTKSHRIRDHGSPYRPTEGYGILP